MHIVLLSVSYIDTPKSSLRLGQIEWYALSCTCFLLSFMIILIHCQHFLPCDLWNPLFNDEMNNLTIWPLILCHHTNRKTIWVTLTLILCSIINQHVQNMLGIWAQSNFCLWMDKPCDSSRTAFWDIVLCSPLRTIWSIRGENKCIQCLAVLWGNLSGRKGHYPWVNPIHFASSSFNDAESFIWRLMEWKRRELGGERKWYFPEKQVLLALTVVSEL